MRAGGTQQKPAMMTRVHAAPLTFVEDGPVGAWIAPRLGPLGGWVGSAIPRGFPAYARVLHPVPDSAVGPAWAHVCEVTGSRPHATMQWESIVCRPGEYRRPEMADGNPWPGGDPSIGHLEPEPLVALCDVLADHVHHGSDVFSRSGMATAGSREDLRSPCCPCRAATIQGVSSTLRTPSHLPSTRK